MPSPFPGMDPFFEGRENWRGFHSQYIANLSSLINEQLPAPFVAAVEERVYLATDRPDAIVAGFAIVRNLSPVTSLPERDGVAVIERTQAELLAPMRQARIFEAEIRERFIQIVNPRHGDKRGRQVVTVIEVLSPTNKRGEGRDVYQRKQWKPCRARRTLSKSTYCAAEPRR